MTAFRSTTARFLVALAVAVALSGASLLDGHAAPAAGATAHDIAPLPDDVAPGTDADDAAPVTGDAAGDDLAGDDPAPGFGGLPDDAALGHDEEARLGDEPGPADDAAVAVPLDDAQPEEGVYLLPGFNARLGSGFNGDVRSASATEDGGLLVAGNFTALAGSSAIPNRLVRLHGDGSLDTAFNANLGSGFGGVVYHAIELSDGGVLAAGNFTSLAGSSAIPNRLVKLRADGTLDTAFNVRLGSGFGSAVWSVAEAPDGGILVAGAFRALGGNPVPTGLVKLRADGALDTDFTARLGTGFGAAVYTLEVAADGGILVGGAFSTLDGSGQVPARLLRLHADGSLDTGFNARAGTGFGGVVRAVRTAPAGGLTVGGEFTTFNGSSAIPNRLVRLTADGGLDGGFNAGLGSGFDRTVWDIAHLEDGGVLVGGEFRSLGGARIPARLLRLDADGVVDDRFAGNLGSGLNATVFTVSANEAAEGGYLAGGSFRQLNASRFIPARLLFLQPDGTPGPDVNSQLGSGFNGAVRVARETSDGKLLVGGNFTALNGSSAVPNRFVRLNGDGSPDVDFNSNLGSGFGTVVYDVAETPDGGILVAGNFTALNGSSAIPNRLVKLRGDGTLDSEFNAALGSGFGTAVWSLDVAPDGGILVAGNFTALDGSSAIPNRLVRLNPDGTLDQAFNAALGSGFGAVVYDLETTPEGQVLVGGNFTSLNGSSAIPNRVVRLHGDGTLDQGFNAALGSGFNSAVWSVAAAGTDQVLVGGNFTSLNGSSAIPNRVVRLHGDGTLDQACNAALGSGFNRVVYSVQSNADGGVLVGGDHRQVGGRTAPRRVTLLNANGSVNREFADQLGTRGLHAAPVYTTSEVRVSGSGYLVGGDFTRLDGSYAIPARLIMLHTAASVDEDAAVAAPRIVVPAVGDRFAATGLVRGTGQPGRVVSVLADGSVLGTAEVNAQGDWMFRVPAALAPGHRTIEAVQDDTEETADTSFDVVGHALELWGDGVPGHTAPAAEVRVVQVDAAADGGPVVALTADGDAIATGPGADLAEDLPGDLVQVAVGGDFALGLTAGGSVVSTGGGTGATEVPAAVRESGAVAVEAGPDTALALLADGSVVAWGVGAAGQTAVPQTLEGVTVAQLSAGTDHVLALTAAGDIVGWGAAGAGQTDVPTRPDDEDESDDDEAGFPTFVQVVAGSAFSLALDDEGEVTGWGRSAEGQLAVPEEAQGLVRRVDAGAGGAVALLETGAVAVWGAGAGAWGEPSPELGRMVVADVLAGTDLGAALVDRVDVLTPADGATLRTLREIAGTAAPGTTVSVAVEKGDGTTGVHRADVGADGRWTVSLVEDRHHGPQTVTAVSAAGATHVVSVDVALDIPSIHLLVRPRVQLVDALAS
ncbi:hypothetical protein [Cellulomonas sp. GbtcB1]|uniref:hypothetical protein n=1 Tax=Cellulomonas sp. GbtcB1 TaxID=2824746 RepID=UPI001C2FC81B|nr:hypothetical protein [Cellulomonas sp. GbtcB1]